jgi:hypothetical protein
MRTNQRAYTMAAIVIGCMGAASSLAAQAVDSPTRRATNKFSVPSAVRFCTECGANMRFDKPRGIRIVDVNEHVLFMSAGDPTNFVWGTPQAEALNDLDDAHLTKLDIGTATTAAKLYGKQYANGIVSIILKVIPR